MTVIIKKQTKSAGLIRTIEKIAGVDLSVCYQCQKCSGGCPAVPHVQTTPSEIVRRLQLGAGDELLDSDLIWMCLSCKTCYARCPMGINVCAVMDALRALALEKDAARPDGDMPRFNREFLGTVRRFGRSYDIGMIMAYKLGTGKLMDDAEKFPAMLKKGKMALLPPSGTDRKTVKRIFAKTAPNKRTGK
ncbi:MAG: 4Fe-4S dicluster domain-containing protein [Dehalococcoidales bacterium]|nr:4Fe-4S dicluster domain-containing protein [Dehalococcoidales bacterium]